MKDLSVIPSGIMPGDYIAYKIADAVKTEQYCGRDGEIHEDSPEAEQDCLCCCHRLFLPSVNLADSITKRFGVSGDISSCDIPGEELF